MPPVIAIEGPPAVGKTTHALKLAAALRARGLRVNLHTRALDTGYTPLERALATAFSTLVAVRATDVDVVVCDGWRETIHLTRVAADALGRVAAARELADPEADALYHVDLALGLTLPKPRALILLTAPEEELARRDPHASELRRELRAVYRRHFARPAAFASTEGREDAVADAVLEYALRALGRLS